MSYCVLVLCRGTSLPAVWCSMLAEVSGAGLNSVSDDQDECPSKPVLQELLQGHFCAAEQQAYMGYGDF